MKSADDRFWDKVEVIPERGCWEWMAAKNPDGYGLFWAAGKMVLAHRFAFEMENGPISDGLFACHRCDNPGCVNPNHIFLGDNASNMADREQKRRGNHASGELHGCAKLTSAQVAEIRRTYAAGGATQQALGGRFGVSRSTVADVIHGKRWKQVIGGENVRF